MRILVDSVPLAARAASRGCMDLEPRLESVSRIGTGMPLAIDHWESLVFACPIQRVESPGDLRGGLTEL